MSWICVVGIKVVVEVEKRYGELVDVCIPRPRRTSSDSSIRRLIFQCVSTMDSNYCTCVAAPQAKIEDRETETRNNPPIDCSRDSSSSILDEAEIDKHAPGPGTKNHFHGRKIDEEHVDTD